MVLPVPCYSTIITTSNGYRSVCFESLNTQIESIDNLFL